MTPQQSGTRGVRSDCENMAPCGKCSRYHCRIYCKKDAPYESVDKCPYGKPESEAPNDK